MTDALQGLRVLELADEAGMYCGKLLADLGADVLRVALPQPHVIELHDRYLNTSKCTLELDLDVEDDRGRIAALAREADLLIETLPPGRLVSYGLGFETLREANPGLVMTSITGFGQSGPHRDHAWSDLVANAVGGAIYVTGDPETPPVNLAGEQAYRMASTCAAASSLIALRHRNATGRGQHVDISAQEVMVAVTHISGVGKYLDDGMVPVRNGTSLFAAVPSGAYPCKDGLIYLIVNRPAHWEALAKWIHQETGNEEVMLEMFEGPSSVRIEYRDLLDIFITDLTSKFTVDEVYHEGQRRHIAMTPVQTVADLRRDPHLEAREFFVDVEDEKGERITMPGPPYRLSKTPWSIGKPSSESSGPAADATFEDRPDANRRVRSTESGTGEGALSGLRVIEFTAGMAGPWVGRFMAWCGAEVIKVESVKRPGVVRMYIPPRERELGVQPALSPWFTDWDGGKRFVCLDLQNQDAVELAKDLVATADVVIENNSTGVMEKLGLGFDVLSQRKPDLVQLSSTGYGAVGPLAKYVTWGPNIETLSGLSRLSGQPGSSCTNTQYAYPDALSALHGVVAVMAALDHRDRTGEGQLIQMAQLEATIASLGTALMEPLCSGIEPDPAGNTSQVMSPHNVYPCAGDDRWCAISVQDDVAWRSFCRVLGREAWLDDARYSTLAGRLEHRDALDREIEQWTTQHSPHEVMQRLQEVGVAAGVVGSIEDTYERDPHLRARGFFEEIPHLVKGSVVASGIPLGLSETPGRTWRAGAGFGCDNDHVFGELLGLDAETLAHHRASGAIETP
ncbi:MAG: CoA transferase [Myxococcota bacterium]|nr:CoA transferase [Myxococcota bacterium]